MADSPNLIAANYDHINTVGQALQVEHRTLDQMTQELNTQLKRATWVSQSNETFTQIMGKYNANMAELHSELNQLAKALVDAGVKLNDTDRYVASHTFGGGK
jgi:WXG100 family type VII secretion target